MTVPGGADPTSNPVDEVAELFEDENEHFIETLEKGKEPVTAPEPEQHLDELLPDVEHEEEPHEEPLSEQAQPIEIEEAVAETTPAPEMAPVEEIERIVTREEPMSPMAEIPIDIQLEIGKLSCSLQKLIDLHENDVLELDQPIGQTIDLRVEGRLIGRGQIVRLGDQLGLRISELADR